VENHRYFLTLSSKALGSKGLTIQIVLLVKFSQCIGSNLTVFLNDKISAFLYFIARQTKQVRPLFGPIYESIACFFSGFFFIRLAIRMTSRQLIRLLPKLTAQQSFYLYLQNIQHPTAKQILKKHLGKTAMVEALELFDTKLSTKVQIQELFHRTNNNLKSQNFDSFYFDLMYDKILTSAIDIDIELYNHLKNKLLFLLSKNEKSVYSIIENTKVKAMIKSLNFQVDLNIFKLESDFLIKNVMANEVVRDETIELVIELLVKREKVFHAPGHYINQKLQDVTEEIDGKPDTKLTVYDMFYYYLGIGFIPSLNLLLLLLKHNLHHDVKYQTQSSFELSTDILKLINSLGYNTHEANIILLKSTKSNQDIKKAIEKIEINTTEIYNEYIYALLRSLEFEQAFDLVLGQNTLSTREFDKMILKMIKKSKHNLEASRYVIMDLWYYLKRMQGYRFTEEVMKEVLMCCVKAKDCQRGIEILEHCVGMDVEDEVDALKTVGDESCGLVLDQFK
jgi:sulfur carrier protein ThiS